MFQTFQRLKQFCHYVHILAHARAHTHTPVHEVHLMASGHMHILACTLFVESCFGTKSG